MKKHLTTEEFIIKSKEIHGDKYNYSKVICINDFKKVIIICPKHGEFYQAPYTHIVSKCGCTHCGRGVKITEEIINDLINVHGDKYDYSKTIYVDGYTNMIITCPEHGDFNIRYNEALKEGCPKCLGKFKRDTEMFIQQSKEIYGDKYDYSKTIYVNTLTDLILIIKETNKQILVNPKKHLSYLKLKTYYNDRRKNNPLFKLSCNIRSLIGFAIRNNGYTKKSRTHEILGCSFEEFKLHIESHFEPWMSWDNYGNPDSGYPEFLNETWDIDHIIPCSSSTSEDELLKLNHFSNLRPLCSYTNRYIKRNNLEV